FTNHTFVVYPILCLSSNAGLNQGIEKMTFIRRDFDSLLGRFWQPTTNTYTITTVTNNQVHRQTIRRIITQPDIVFSAGDIVTPPTTAPLIIPTVAREIPRWNTNDILPSAGLFGPGTIEPPVNFTFDKIAPILINTGPF